MPKISDLELITNTQDGDYFLVSRDMGGGVWQSKKITASVIPFSDVFTWTFNGDLLAGSEQDGFRTVQANGKISKVVVTAAERGATGTAIFDINKHTPEKPITIQRNDCEGETIYTTQDNRPQIVGENGHESERAILEASLPDIITFSEGDFFSLDVDDIGGGSNKDFAIQVFVQYNMT